MQLKWTGNTAFLLLLLAGCDAGPNNDDDLIIFAAASTAEVMEQIADRFEEETGITTKVSAASSSVLARQIESGAPADMFLSADQIWMDHIATSEGLPQSLQSSLLSNRLVLATHADSPFTFNWEGSQPLHEAFVGRWVMGNPTHVPVGRYGQQALEHSQSWAKLKPRLLPALDAAAAANLLAMGEVPLGLLYATDVSNNPSLRIAAVLPTSLHDAIVYPLAVLNDSESSKRFAQFLQAKQQLDLFREHGFQIVGRD